MTVGANGLIYYTTLQNGANNAAVVAIDTSGNVVWSFAPLVGGTSYNFWNTPVYFQGDDSIFIGSDAGVFYSLDASDGTELWSYTVTGTAPDKRIRSTAAVNVGVIQTYVFFHCNDGNLYALRTVSGSFRWKKPTGNVGGPPPVSGVHDETWSSSPVIGADGAVYVGSADGKVYAFVATTGANKWPGAVNLGAPIEATIAIAADGWLYTATRRDAAGAGGKIFAINPAKAAVDPTQAVEWSGDVPHDSFTEPGVIASLVIDQGGFVYVADFHNNITKYHPKPAPPPAAPQTAVQLRNWNMIAKYCQTPSLTQDGLLVVGTSAENGVPQDKRAIRAFHTGKLDSPYWTVPQVPDNQVPPVLQDVGDFLGAPAIICSSGGTTYIADMDMATGAGRIYTFEAGSTLMAGDWPTFQAGNRRIGKVKTYSYTITELSQFPGGVASSVVGGLDPYGRAVGATGGSLCGNDPDERWPALWLNGIPSHPGLCDPAIADWLARTINGFGDVAGYVGAVPIAWANGAYDNSVAYVTLPIPGFSYGYAADINSSSIIVGYASSGSTINVFRWDKLGNSWIEQPIGAPTASDQAYAYAISDQARIAGKARFVSPTSPWHAYVTPDNPSGINGDLGTLGGLESEAWDVNDETGTVGWANNGSAQRRAFYIQIGGVSLQPVNELPRLAGTTGNSYYSEAYGVNRLGQVVGKIQNDSGAYRAFWWKTPGPGTQLTDLTTMVLDGGQTPQSLGWTLTSAVAVNDGSIIVGYGLKSGSTRAWILYPKCQE